MVDLILSNGFGEFIYFLIAFLILGSLFWYCTIKNEENTILLLLTPIYSILLSIWVIQNSYEFPSIFLVIINIFVIMITFNKLSR